MDVIIRQCAKLGKEGELMQIAIVLRTTAPPKRTVKYMLYTEDQSLVDCLEKLWENKEPIDLEALDVLLTAAEWPKAKQ